MIDQLGVTCTLSVVRWYFESNIERLYLVVVLLRVGDEGFRGNVNTGRDFHVPKIDTVCDNEVCIDVKQFLTLF